MSANEWDAGFQFEILAEAPNSRARLGKLTTPHGVIYTPAFMPVGTYGAVKGIAPEEIESAGGQIMLANALHLEFRPNSQTVATLGGLHRLMNWNKPTLTDSGGFQTYSLAKLMRCHEDGIEVRSPIDGSKGIFTPENVVQIQRRLGTDFIMPLDVCAPGSSDWASARQAMQRTLRWAERSIRAFRSSDPMYRHPQAHLGIIQGGIHPDLRRQATEEMLELDFFGYAIGGLAVGESKDDMWSIVGLCNELLPKSKPRYLMGVGTPEDLLQATSLGIDLFDCVLPTRNGRKGSLFVQDGKMNLRNAMFRDDAHAIEEECTCAACRQYPDGTPNFSRGVVRHLLNIGDPLGARLGSLHNLTFYFRLMAQIRERIRAGVISVSLV
ncbi:MAG: tRNA guanosine(34) transglycosylase Tgt [bacterium]